MHSWILLNARIWLLCLDYVNLSAVYCTVHTNFGRGYSSIRIRTVAQKSAQTPFLQAIKYNYYHSPHHKNWSCKLQHIFWSPHLQFANPHFLIRSLSIQHPTFCFRTSQKLICLVRHAPQHSSRNPTTGFISASFARRTNKTKTWNAARRNFLLVCNELFSVLINCSFQHSV